MVNNSKCLKNTLRFCFFSVKFVINPLFFRILSIICKIMKDFYMLYGSIIISLNLAKPQQGLKNWKTASKKNFFQAKEFFFQRF